MHGCALRPGHSLRSQRIPPDPGLTSALLGDLDLPAGPETTRLARFLHEAFGRATLALVHYGSHSHGAGPEPESARDFFVILDDYGEGYRSLHASIQSRRSPGFAAFLNRVLPPNVLSVSPRQESVLVAKCAVIRLTDLARACSTHAPDHFVRGRLFQPVRLVWSRDERARDAVRDAILAARTATFAWIRPCLPERFDALEYCRRMLEVSYAAEIRPESGDHVSALLLAQREHLLEMYGPFLESLVTAGVLAHDQSRFRDLAPPSGFARARSRFWFARSKLRATLRWCKYIALYDDWLDYVIRKLERRSGVSLNLSPLERRWPLIFLWPKALRYLVTRPQRRT